MIDIKVNLICSLFLLYVFVPMPGSLAAPAGGLDYKGKPDPRMDSIQEEVLLNDARMPMDPAVEASLNNGYWWIKQDYGAKLKYAKELIKAFKLKKEFIGLTSKEIVRKLDIVYNPKGDPLDTKMGLSLEEAFSLMIKENAK